MLIKPVLNRFHLFLHQKPDQGFYLLSCLDDPDWSPEKKSKCSKFL